MLQLTRTVTETTVDGNQLWLVRFEITQASLGADPYVFLHHYVAVNPYVQQADTEFIGVCSLADMAEYPVAEPSLETPNPFFRTNVGTVYCASTAEAEELAQIIEEELGVLVEITNKVEELETVEELWIGGTPPQSSSSSSSSSESPVATAPQNLVVTNGFDTVSLSWDFLEDAYNYQVKRRVVGSEVWVTLYSAVGGTTFKDYTPEFDTVYEYKVRGRYDDGSWSDWSDLAVGGAIALAAYSPELHLDGGFYSRTGGQFTAANSQHLSVASNPSLQTGDAHYWGAAYVYADSLSGAGNVIYARWVGWPEIALFVHSYQTRIVVRADDTYPVASGPAIPLSTWKFLFYFHDPDSKLLGLIIDNVLYTKTYTGTHWITEQATAIGAYAGGSYPFDGRIDNVLFGKPPTALGDGTAGSLAHEIATSLYKSGVGLPFESITAQQRSDWGIVSGWLNNSLTADYFGSNDLTNVNGVTQAAGKVSALAVENDPIYLFQDKSTHTRNAIQDSLTSRALLIDDYSRFDGVNDVYELNGLTIDTSDATLFFVVHADADIGTNTERAILSSSDTFAVFWIDRNNWAVTIDDVDTRPNGYYYSDNILNKVVLRYEFKGLSRKLYVNGDLAWDMPATFSAVYTLNRIGSFFGFAQWKGKMWHASVFSGISSWQGKKVEDYLMAKHLP